MRVYFLLLLLLWSRVVRALGGRALQRVPPSRVENRPSDGGGFTGYRQIFQSECLTLATQWQRKLGVVSGSMNIEQFEQLRLLDDCAAAMPGAKPQRRELMAFAEFEDGSVKAVSLGYCTKVKCPWEMTVLAIVGEPSERTDRSDAMVTFIRELCKDNAIWPDFTLLDKWSLFRDKKWVKQSHFSGVAQPPSQDALASSSRALHEAVTALYKLSNPAPSMVLDDGQGPNVRLPPFWFRISLENRIAPLDFYFRQRREDDEEVRFDVRFDPPVTGVSSGMPTVGCAIIIDVGNYEQVSQYLDQSNADKLRMTAAELSRKVKLPTELDQKNDTVVQELAARIAAAYEPSSFVAPIRDEM